MNVMNTRDASFVGEFLRCFSLPEAEALENGLTEEMYREYHRPQRMNGISAFIESCSPCFQLFPDTILLFHEVSHSISVLVFSLSSVCLLFLIFLVWLIITGKLIYFSFYYFSDSVSDSISFSLLLGSDHHCFG
jgi:hypothetical protein